jgi:hypothetical protein
LKQRLQQGQTELSDLRQIDSVTFTESQKARQGWDEANYTLIESTAALIGLKQQVSELKSALVAVREVLEQIKEQHH